MAPVSSSLVSLIIINVLISILGIFGNVLVLLAVIKNSFLQTVPDLFIFSLALADLIVNGLQQPMLTYRIYRNNNPDLTLNSIIESIGFLAILASITSMFVVTIDRFIAIQRPFLYIRLATTKRAVWVILTFWIVCLTYTIATYFINGKIKYFIMWMYISLLLISIVVMYVYLFIAAKKQQNKINESSGGHVEGNVPFRTRRRNERKPAKTIAIVVGVFIAFWTPFLVFVISNSDILENQDKDLLIVFYWMLSLSLWNSSINPYIYCVRNSRYRLAFAKMLRLQHRVQLESSQAFSYAARPPFPRVSDVRVFNSQNEEEKV